MISFNINRPFKLASILLSTAFLVTLTNRCNSQQIATTPEFTVEQQTTATTDSLHPVTPVCQISLANNVTDRSLRHAFLNVAQDAKLLVYFHFRTTSVQGPTTTSDLTSAFSVAGPDTFLPDVWLWATTRGKNLLRMPIDYGIMSLGLLTINTHVTTIVIDSSTTECLSRVNYSYAAHLIAKFLIENITTNGTLTPSEQQQNRDDANNDAHVVCRSAYAFRHDIFGDRGVGFRCCSRSSTVAPVSQALYECDTPYSDGWHIVWYGPVALLCWVYAIAFIHFYKLYSHAFNKQQIRELSGLERTLDEIKQDVVTRIVAMSKRWVRVHDVVDLIALREPCAILDVLGVNKLIQSQIVGTLNVCFLVAAIAVYYGACAALISAYRYILEPDVIRRLKDTQSVYLNVIGHFGWLFVNDDILLFRYAVFELAYTIAVPVFAAVIYLSIAFHAEAKSFAEMRRRKATALVVAANRISAPAVLTDDQIISDSLPSPSSPSASKTLLLTFITSRCGKAIQAVSCFLLVVYVIFVGGVFVSYTVYFVGLGMFANVAVVTPYIIPIFVCAHFFVTVFDPVTNLYNTVKECLFSVCSTSFKDLVIRRHNELFIPRALIEEFYVPRSKKVLYACLLRTLWVIASMILLILVILTLQFPYYHETDSVISVLCVQLVFILPLIAQNLLRSAPPSSLEQAIMQSDVEDYVSKYVSEHPEIVPISTLRKKSSRVGHCGGRGRVSELFARSISRDPGAKSAADLELEMIIDERNGVGDVK